MAKWLKLYATYTFSTSPNLRHRSTLLNTDVPNGKLSHNTTVHLSISDRSRCVNLAQFLEIRSTKSEFFKILDMVTCKTVYSSQTLIRSYETAFMTKYNTIFGKCYTFCSFEHMDVCSSSSSSSVWLSMRLSMRRIRPRCFFCVVCHLVWLNNPILERQRLSH